MAGIETLEWEGLQHLALALAVGLLIGLERGWQQREAEEGTRIAGLRTFGLIGLLGGVFGVLANELGALILAFGFAGLAATVISAYHVAVPARRDIGITSLIAALVTFALGALASLGYLYAASAGAVATAVLLGSKAPLHRWLASLERYELTAALQLAVLSVVILPLLPNEAVDPWGALNPYRLWWFVVLISAIAVAGHFAMRFAGAERGILLTSFFGGLASSTALTLMFARLGRRQAELQALLAAGVLIAGGTMFPRMLVEVAVVNPALLAVVAPPVGVMAALAYLGAFWIWWRERDVQPPPPGAAQSFSLASALQFGVLLGVVMVLATLAERHFGDAGVYVLALVSGVTDVDAITLSLAELAKGSLAPRVAAEGMVVAAMTNTVAKALLVMSFCGGTMGRQVGVAGAAVVLAGGAWLFLG